MKTKPISITETPISTPNFRIGDATLSLSDAYCGIAIVGSQKTFCHQTLTIPLITEIFQTLSNHHPDSINARAGGLFIARDPEFIRSLIPIFADTGREGDIIHIDPCSPGFEINPIQPHLSPKENAQHILESFPTSPANEFWVQSARNLIEDTITLLEALTPPNQLNLPLVYKSLANAETIKQLCDTYNDHKHNLSSYTKPNNAYLRLKTHLMTPSAPQGNINAVIHNTLGELLNTPQARNIFENSPTVDFSKAYNDGKIFLYLPSQSLPPPLSEYLIKIIKLNFDHKIKTRNNYYPDPVNTTRSLVFLSDNTTHTQAAETLATTNLLATAPATKTISILCEDTIEAFTTALTDSQNAKHPIEKSNIFENISNIFFFQSNDAPTNRFALKLKTQSQQSDSTIKLKEEETSPLFTLATPTPEQQNDPQISEAIFYQYSRSQSNPEGTQNPTWRLLKLAFPMKFF